MKNQLLLLHGALGNKNQFSSIKTRLEEYYEVHELNFEGHGEQATSHDFSIALFTNNVIDYLEQNNIGQVNIFGFSLGGYVALNLALKRPELINQIITLGTKFNWSEEAAAKEVKMLNPDIIELKVPQFAEQLKKIHEPKDWKELVRKTATMMTNMSKGAKLFDEDFKKINHKVSIGLGTLDRMVSQTESEHVVNLIPRAEFIMLDGVKHPIEIADSAVVSDYILKQLA